MAETILTNFADFTVTRLGEEVDFSTNEVSTTIVQGITATKTADKAIWVNGLLTYTIVVANNSGEMLSGGTFADRIDTSLINLYADGSNAVYVNGAPVVYTYIDGLITVALPDIADGETITITFSVEQV